MFSNNSNNNLTDKVTGRVGKGLCNQKGFEYNSIYPFLT